MVDMADAAQNLQNGHKEEDSPNAGMVGLEDIFAFKAGHRDNFFEGIITTDNNPNKFLSQAYTTPEEVAAEIRFLMDEEMYDSEDGDISMSKILWYRNARSLAIMDGSGQSRARSHLTMLFSGGGGGGPIGWMKEKLAQMRGGDPQKNNMDGR